MTQMRLRYIFALAAAVATTLAPGAARAQTSYKIQPIVKFGDKVTDRLGDVALASGDSGWFYIGGLTDNGQIALIAEKSGGGMLLIQYADGQLTPIVVPNRDAPGGIWNPGPAVWNPGGPGSMNQAGNILFAAHTTAGLTTRLGTFLWDYKAQKTSAVVFKGMPADNNRIIERPGGTYPKINNRNEIALGAQVAGADTLRRDGIFLLGQDGKLIAVAIADQALPGGRKVHRAYRPSLNDAGMITFLAQEAPGRPFSAYLWENGTTSPLAIAGTTVPGAGTIDEIQRAWVNNQNRSVLVLASVGGSLVLLRFADGKLTRVLRPGQDLPGGDKLKNLGESLTISSPNEAGQHAFLANLSGGGTGAYLLEADGKLSRILRSGTTTDLGTVTALGVENPPLGISLNSKGQVAVGLKYPGAPYTLCLLTPVTP
jgi:hypothetical protein